MGTVLTRAVFAVAIAFGAGVLAPSGTAMPAAAAMADASGQTSTPPADPDVPGGALPVLPAHGGCIIGLNCGCIRGTTGPCSGPPLLKHPAIHLHPGGVPNGPAEGHG